jgi:nicotinate phosphoribosyltransferase
LKSLYGHSLSLLTDLYQLTMAYGYWRAGLADRQAVFHLFFRKPPFGGGYAIAAGLAHVIDFLADFSFDADELAYLATLTGNDGAPLFDQGFLDHLGALRLTCDVDAVTEGTVVFAHEPLVRVTGSLIAAQLIETPLLNLINFQTLIATKAARICHAAQGEPVLEFGLRRAQGIDGGLSASRAAYIGGCAATSNVLAGKLFDIPVKGTHAHSWVMTFDTERDAFEAYAAAMPNNCVFLVDTYDTVEGVKNAVRVGKQLRERGHEMVGVRLDSGDLAYLSIQARQILDDGGFPDAAVVASNDLSEEIIASLKQQGAKIGVWGVGTKLATAFDQPALGGVYKLAAIADADGVWQPKIKLSEQAIKVSNPGILGVRRYTDGDAFIGDLIYDQRAPLTGPVVMVDPADATRRKRLPADAPYQELLVPVMRGGQVAYTSPSTAALRDRAAAQLGGLHDGSKRLLNPHSYPVGLEQSLHELKHRLILQARGFAQEPS